MATIADLGEFGLIARLTAELAQQPDVLLGVGDDAAILAVGDGDALVATCDAQVEGIHFRLHSSTPQDIGRRALAVNLSDIAAMGATPRFALISLLAPATLDVSIIDGIYAGLREEAATFHVTIVGGNVARNPERLIIDVTLLGTGDRHQLLRRAGAQPGDALYVTGALGTAAAGLRVMEQETVAATLPPTVRQIVTAAQRTPTPQVAAGLWLAAHGATAALDISDGLAADLLHLCQASGVGALVDVAALPILPATDMVAQVFGKGATTLALYGGEDYQVLFTLPATTAETSASQLMTATGITVTRIGTMTAEPAVLVTQAGQTTPLLANGWDHMR